jgi:hypothetical protein
LSPGHADFKASDLLPLIRKLTASGHAPATILILDTARKFVNPMDKNQCLHFGIVVREYVSKGGSAVTLCHVNKNRDMGGRPIPAGTSDFVDDADAAYLLDTINDVNDIRTVEFENFKCRGAVAKQATYQYSTSVGLGYGELLESVLHVDDMEAQELKKAATRMNHPDTLLIQDILGCINSGVTAKTKIVEKVAPETGCSQRQVQRVLENHTGTDPSLHKWNFSIGPHGVKTFELLPTPDDVPDTEEL